MPRLSATTLVMAEPEVVFRVLEAPPGPLLPKGGPHLARLDAVPGEGTRYRWEFKRFGLGFRLDSIVTDYRPGQRLIFKGVGGWTMDAQVDLRPDAGGTRLDFRIRYQFGAPLRWLVPGALIRLGIWHALRQVKAMCEEQAAAHVLST